MRLLIAALAMALMVMSAQAQMSPSQNSASQLGQHAEARRAGADDSNKPKANDKAYNAALKNLPDKQYDPWHGVR
jgi:hypothetical protein